MTRIARRLPSIDVFRAITMLLMIFVNDLVLDKNIPDWLEHAREGEDRLGFADIIFPAFLFIVGLSIPLAIRMGKERGLSNGATLWNILRRSFALLVMGFSAYHHGCVLFYLAGLSRALARMEEMVVQGYWRRGVGVDGPYIQRRVA